MQTLYTTSQKFGVGKFFLFVCLCFERSLLCSARLHLFYQKYSKKQQFCEIYFVNITFMKYNYFHESLSHMRKFKSYQRPEKSHFILHMSGLLLIQWILGNHSINFWVNPAKMCLQTGYF